MGQPVACASANSERVIIVRRQAEVGDGKAVGCSPASGGVRRFFFSRSRRFDGRRGWDAARRADIGPFGGMRGRALTKAGMLGCQGAEVPKRAHVQLQLQHPHHQWRKPAAATIAGAGGYRSHHAHPSLHKQQPEEQRPRRVRRRRRRQQEGGRTGTSSKSRGSRSSEDRPPRLGRSMLAPTPRTTAHQPRPAPLVTLPWARASGSCCAGWRTIGRCCLCRWMAVGHDESAVWPSSTARCE